MKYILFLLFPIFSDAQIITSIAGGGVTIGDGGPATAAIINDPGECLFNRQGIFYVTSGVSGNRIRKIDTSGIISTIAGTGVSGYSGDGSPATSAKLNYPLGLALDSNGNIFFSENQNNTIRKINISTGIISTVCGNGVPGSSGDGGPATSALLYAPQGICFDKFGNLYIADGENNKVRKIDVSGMITTFAGTGVYGFNGDGIAATLAQLHLPTDIASDDSGNIYVSDAGNARIRKVNVSGIISTFAGNGNGTYIGDGVAATNAQFTPDCIKIDSMHNFYISDGGNFRVYRIDAIGNFYNYAGNGMATNGGDGGLATSASIHYPSGLAIDRCGNLYISNVNYNRIRKITYNPTCDPYSHGHIDSASLQTKELVDGKIAIYPNPACSSFTISSTQKIKQIIITNFMGEEVYTGVYDIEKAEVNIAGLPEGVYVVRATDDEGSVTMSKIVKQ